MSRYGACHWSTIAAFLPQRSGKQARERWINQLDPTLKKKNWTVNDDRVILSLHARVGNKWSSIAPLLEGRTDNAVKNRFNSTLKRAVRQCVQQGSIDIRKAVARQRRQQHALLKQEQEQEEREGGFTGREVVYQTGMSDDGRGQKQEAVAATGMMEDYGYEVEDDEGLDDIAMVDIDSDINAGYYALLKEEIERVVENVHSSYNDKGRQRGQRSARAFAYATSVTPAASRRPH